ncbi:hypothetical protein CPC08DRAFT_738189 [Agrocybe pediades]|nr:hypothetical protein CPC08DRAFT_738189 [Agrocybe pediades]
MTPGGVRLREMTQAKLYKALRKDDVSVRRRTAYNLEEAREAVLDWTGREPTQEELWHSLRDKTIPYNIRAFLWKAMHSAYMVGDYWRGIPGFEQRVDCQLCGEEDSLRHILTSCRASGQSTIWAEVKRIWRHKKLPWREISLGAVLGCSLLNITTPSGRALRGPSRLLKILVSESAHLAWKIRWEWTMEHNGDPQKILSESEVRRRWERAINARLLLDMLQTNRTKYDHRAISPQLVEATWWDVLLDDDWIITKSGVLVGTGRRPPGRNR